MRAAPVSPARPPDTTEALLRALLEGQRALLAGRWNRRALVAAVAWTARSWRRATGARHRRLDAWIDVHVTGALAPSGGGSGAGRRAGDRGSGISAHGRQVAAAARRPRGGSRADCRRRDASRRQSLASGSPRVTLAHTRGATLDAMDIELPTMTHEQLRGLQALDFVRYRALRAKYDRSAHQALDEFRRCFPMSPLKARLELEAKAAISPGTTTDAGARRSRSRPDPQKASPAWCAQGRFSAGCRRAPRRSIRSCR